MRILKLADSHVQIFLILLTTFSFVDTRFSWTAFSLLCFWQLLSVVTHKILSHRIYTSRQRNNFLLTALLTLSLTTLLLWFGYLIVLLWLPVSVWYACINRTEAMIITRKQLVHLK